MMRSGIVAAIILFAHAANAGNRDGTPETGKLATPDDKRVVLLNATSSPDDLGSVQKIRRVLDTRGLLVDIPDGLAATLDGRSIQLADLDAIRDAYGSAQFARALTLVDDNETRILQSLRGDPLPALAELAGWRALVAMGEGEIDESISWFRAALRFNPAWSAEGAVASPKVERLIRRARKEPEEIGRLQVTADPAGATVQIDGAKPVVAHASIALSVGYHVVVVAAAGRTTHAKVVEITDGETARVEISLDAESKQDRAARLVDAAAAAAPGEARLRKVRGMSRFVGATRFLVIEDTNSDRARVRVYDVDEKRVSKPIDVARSASSSAIVTKVLSALEPDSFIDVRPGVAATAERGRPWYGRWYVWAGVAAVVGGGSALGYYYYQSTRDPTAVRGF